MRNLTVINDAGWSQKLSGEFSSGYFKSLTQELENEYNSHTVYPPADKIFQALEITPLEQVKVVILGQDPYHGDGQAHGLAFSVPEGVQHPPSLRNIFKELQEDLGQAYPRSGDLSPWARQGVLLLNTGLTVRQKAAGSHTGLGWSRFTDAIISTINREKQGVIFVLWGSLAQQKKPLISTPPHHLIEAPHPSPLSAYRGFFGSRPFSNINAILQEQGHPPINWQL